MKCLKCNNELLEGIAFCPHCGTAVPKEEAVKKVSLKCENCGGILQVDSEQSVLSCPYCEHKSLIVENDAVTIERIRTSATKEIELEKIKSNDRQQKVAEEKEQRQEDKELVEKFKKSKLAKLLVIVFVISAICAYYCFSKGLIGAGVLSLLQAGCFGVAWTMGMQIIKEKKRYIHILIAIVGIILIIPTCRACSTGNDSNEIQEMEWNIIFLANEIPEPDSKKLDIHTNTADELWVDVVDTSEEEYYQYIIACKDIGYTVEGEENSIGYKAYNEAGYCLELSKYGSSEEMGIRLKAPTQASELEWEKHSVSSILPQPKSKEGKFNVEGEESAEIIVSKTSQDEFIEYCAACKELGYTIDAESGNDTYAAYDANGNRVSLSYTAGNKEMKIILKYPMKFKDISWPTVGVGTLAPVPNSLSGNVAGDYDWSYTVYLENISREEYEEYEQKCIEAGFDKDIRNYENSLWADYSEDISIHVEYKGFNIMYVNVQGSISEDYSSYKGGDVEVTKEPEATGGLDLPDISDIPVISDIVDTTVDPNFKAMMDSYEVFFDEYIEFMNKYTEASSEDALAMASEYMEYLTQYAETMEKMNEVDTNTLSAADALYYTEVTTRIYTKMLEVAY